MTKLDERYNNMSYDLAALEVEEDENAEIINNLVDKVSEMEKNFQKMATTMSNLQQENKHLQKKSRERNVIIHNLATPLTPPGHPNPEALRENTAFVVAQFIDINKFIPRLTREQIHNLIDEAFRIGATKPRKVKSVLVKFKSKQVRDEIMKVAKIKGRKNAPGDPYFMDDLSPTELARKTECQGFIKVMKDKEVKCYFRNGRVFGPDGYIADEIIDNFNKIIENPGYLESLKAQAPHVIFQLLRPNEASESQNDGNRWTRQGKRNRRKLTKKKTGSVYRSRTPPPEDEIQNRLELRRQYRNEPTEEYENLNADRNSQTRQGNRSQTAQQTRTFNFAPPINASIAGGQELGHYEEHDAHHDREAFSFAQPILPQRKIENRRIPPYQRGLDQEDNLDSNSQLENYRGQRLRMTGAEPDHSYSRQENDLQGPGLQMWTMQYQSYSKIGDDIIPNNWSTGATSYIPSNQEMGTRQKNGQPGAQGEIDKEKGKPTTGSTNREQEGIKQLVQYRHEDQSVFFEKGVKQTARNINP